MRMTVVHGSFATFDSTSEEWTEYVERLEFYFVMNGITDSTKQRAVLLNCCGSSTFRLLRSLVLPAPLTDFSFRELVAKMKAHQEPKPSVIVLRYQFNSRQCATSETVAEYVTALRRLAEYCSFGDILDKMLRDRFVCGIADPAVQKHLLSETDLTFTKAVSIAQAAELAYKGSKEIRASPGDLPENIHKFSYVTNSMNSSQKHTDVAKDRLPTGTCYRCGGKHNHSTCPFKFEVCHFCKKRGHIAKVCRSRPPQWSQNKASVTVDSSKPTRQVTQDPCDAVSPEHTLFTLPSQQTKPLQTDVEVEGHHLNMEIDMGAAVYIISEKTHASLSHLQKLPLQSTQVKLHTYTGESIPVLGELSVNVTCQGTSHILPLLVVKEDGPSLIGRNWLAMIQLDWKKLLDDLLHRHSSVFEDKLGTVKDLKVKLFVKENSLPKFFKARTLPLALREKVSDEIDKLQANGITVPVKFSSWAAPVVPVIKRDGNVRLCGDYMHIFSPSKAIPSMASARLQRWALTLSGYQYSIKYREGSRMCNADALSRLLLPDCPNNVPTPPETIALLEHLTYVPLTSTQIWSMTDRDPVLARVKEYTRNGWPTAITDEKLRPYSSRRDEISLEDGILLWGSRVVIPPQAREAVIE